MLNLIYDGEGHLLTVGSTRSGKGVVAIIPNLLSYTDSVIVIDPKGENVKGFLKFSQISGTEGYCIRSVEYNWTKQFAM